MIYKCKICGGQISIDSQNGIAICDYCGTKQALPLFTEDSARLLYERGNNYLLQSEYDKAESMFSQLLTIMPNDPELYWDLVLCKYGVTYVKDPKTGKYIPTCNRTHYTPIFSDENYKKAIELSSEEKKALYKSNAETIDNIQKGIIAVSKKEKPFDIFISYKETDGNGNRTIDSVEAQNLYEKLTEAGYKVFFSRITLEDKVGAEYEPYIYAALYSSKVMLTVCSSRENIETVWVKNEWSRFLQLRQNDADKTLLPLYFDMQKNELPDEFALLSSYNIKKDDFEQELLRGIKKLIPLPIMKAKRRKQIRKTLSITMAILCSVTIAITAIFLPRYLERKTFATNYDKAISLYEAADYEGAAKIFTELGDYKDSIEMVKNCTNQPKYDNAIQLCYDGKYAEATWIFKSLNDYKDSKEQEQKSETKWRESLSTPAVTCIAGSSGYGSYYISSNGTVETLYNSGALHSNIKIGEHGKVVSISDGVRALFEDGTLQTTQIEYEDIVQVTSGVFCFALKNDGTVLSIGNDYNEYSDSITYSKPIREWTNITELVYHIDNYATFGAGGFCLVGIKSDGSLEWALLDISHGDASRNAGEYLSSLKNIKSISVEVDSSGTLDIDCLAIASLDENNTLNIWSDAIIGKKDQYSSLTVLNRTYEYSYENLDLLDFDININVDYNYESEPRVWKYIIELLVIDNNRTLRVFESNKALQEDVVYFNDGFGVTQTGTIISSETLTSYKTKVHDVWLERK